MASSTVQLVQIAPFCIQAKHLSNVAPASHSACLPSHRHQGCGTSHCSDSPGSNQSPQARSAPVCRQAGAAVTTGVSLRFLVTIVISSLKTISTRIFKHLWCQDSNRNVHSWATLRNDAFFFLPREIYTGCDFILILIQFFKQAD